MNKEQARKQLAESLRYWQDAIKRNANASTPEEMADSIISILGCVWLSEDQEAPSSTLFDSPWESRDYKTGYIECRDKMIAAGFRKVEG